MKKIVSLLLVVALVGTCGLLTGCGSEKDVKKIDKAVSEVNKNVKEIATKVGEVSKAWESGKQEVSKGVKAYEDASKAFKRKPPKKPTVHGSGIVGKWEYNQKDYEIPAVYTFKDDGTGEYNLAGQVQKLTYKTKGNKITITYKGEPDMEQKYKLKGDVLTLYDITDSPVVYYRVG